jgi:DNA-binding HxlR family transcriptional regulator
MPGVDNKRLGETRVLLDLLGDRWTMLVLGSLCRHEGRRRFNAIRRDVPGISQKSLTLCVRRLERNGLVERVVTTAGPLSVEYRLTALGNTLDGPVGSVLDWTGAHAEEVRGAQGTYDGEARHRDGGR